MPRFFDVVVGQTPTKREMELLFRKMWDTIYSNAARVQEERWRIYQFLESHEHWKHTD